MTVGVDGCDVTLINEAGELIGHATMPAAPQAPATGGDAVATLMPVLRAIAATGKLEAMDLATIRATLTGRAGGGD